MMKKNPIIIGDSTFNSKAEATRFYKAILERYSPGAELNEADFKSVLALCRLKWDAKAEAQIDAIIVDYHPAHKGTKCFQIEIEGYLHLFSYMLSINGEMSDMRMFSRACRHAVASRLREYKKEVFRNRPVRCAITNEITEWEECHIDHKAPLTFSVIVKSFAVAQDIDLSRIEYKFDNLVDEFADEKLSDQFRAFHERMAILRILSKKANTKLSASARIAPTKRDTALASTVQRAEAINLQSPHAQNDASQAK